MFFDVKDLASYCIMFIIRGDTIMKTKEELNALKEEVETLENK